MCCPLCDSLPRCIFPCFLQGLKSQRRALTGEKSAQLFKWVVFASTKAHQYNQHFRTFVSVAFFSATFYPLDFSRIGWAVFLMGKNFMNLLSTNLKKLIQVIFIITANLFKVGKVMSKKSFCQIFQEWILTARILLIMRTNISLRKQQNLTGFLGLPHQLKSHMLSYQLTWRSCAIHVMLLLLVSYWTSALNFLVITEHFLSGRINVMVCVEEAEPVFEEEFVPEITLTQSLQDTASNPPTTAVEKSQREFKCDLLVNNMHKWFLSIPLILNSAADAEAINTSVEADSAPQKIQPSSQRKPNNFKNRNWNVPDIVNYWLPYHKKRSFNQNFLTDPHIQVSGDEDCLSISQFFFNIQWWKEVVINY